MQRGSGGSSGPALPQIAHLAARWSADAITPQGDNTSITTGWTDSINGYNVPQATGANQPKYRTNALGTKPGVQFTGSTWFGGLLPALKAIIDTKTYTVFILADKIQVRANAAMFGNSAGGNSFMFQASGTRVGRGIGSNDLRGPYTDTVTPITCGYTTANFKVYTNQSGTALERQYLNGTCIGSNTIVGPATSSANGSFGIGSVNDTGSFPFQGYLYEILVFDSQLTPAEIMQVELWARAKYGLAIPWASLPRMFHFDGNSHTVGVGTTVDVANSFPYANAQSLGLPYGTWCNHAIGGMSTYGMYGGDGSTKFSDMAAVINLTGISPRIVTSEYYNEVNTGRTAQAYSDAVAYIALLKSTWPTSKVGWWEPFSYGTDAATFATNRGPFLASMLANYASLGVDSLQRVSLDTNIGTSDAYTNTPANWTGDTVHLTSASRISFLTPQTLTLCQAINS
jgi:hypothetical protein